MRLLPLAASASLILAACSGHPGHAHVGPGPAPAPVLLESEPNDVDWLANDLGGLYPGTFVVVEGEAQAAFDPIDGFAFTAGAPLVVEASLSGDDFLGDLDLCLYDPVLGDYVACWETAGSQEFGAFTMSPGETLHLVVHAYSGWSPYALSISASGALFAELPDAPEPTERDADRAARTARYRGARAAETSEPTVDTARALLVDRATGEVTDATLVVPR